MRIKLNSQPKPGSDMNALWRNSPCSMNYTLANTAADRARRFEIGSIYHRDQVDKPKKVFNQFQKPDMLRTEFFRLIEEASHPKYYSASKKAAQKTEHSRSRTQSMRNTLNQKLYTVPLKNQYQYDRGGFRSHVFGDYDVRQIQSKVLDAKKNFSSGRRTDLGRPLNFFPGPGTYYPGNDLKTQALTVPLTMRTCIGFKKQRRLSKQNPQSQRIQHQK